MKTANELRDERNTLFTAQEEILERKHADGVSDLTGEELAEFERIEADLDKTERDLAYAVTREGRSAEIGNGGGTNGITPTAVETTDPDERDAAYAEAFTNYLRYGTERLPAEQRAALAQGARRDDGSPAWEQRAIGDAPLTVTTTAGGYLIPRGFQAELSTALKAYGGTRQGARVISTPSGNPIDWPTMDDTGNTGELVAINTTVAEQPTAYGTKALLAYKYSSKIVLVPMELAQDAFFDIQSHLRDTLATRIGRITNTHFTTGDNSGKPQGIVTSAYSAVTSEAATGVTYNDLINLEHSVDPAYRAGGRGAWMFADSTLKVLKKLKDADGNPIWRSGLAGGSPADVDGYPFVINQDMSAATTGLKSVLFGDFSYYVIRDVLDVTLLRLVERYAELGQVGYIAFSRHDGRSVAAETNNGAIRYLLQA